MWTNTWKRYLKAFKGDLKKATAKKVKPEDISNFEEIFTCEQEDYDEDIMFLIARLRDGSLQGEELRQFGEVLLNFYDNELAIEIIVGDVWDGEETSGPVTLEGAEALESDAFKKAALEHLDLEVNGDA